MGQWAGGPGPVLFAGKRAGGKASGHSWHEPGALLCVHRQACRRQQSSASLVRHPSLSWLQQHWHPHWLMPNTQAPLPQQ